MNGYYNYLWYAMSSLCAGFLVLLCTDLINSTKKKKKFP